MTREEEFQTKGNEYAMFPTLFYSERDKVAFVKGAKYADSTAWKSAQGDNLPEIDREVIALVQEHNSYKVVFAHRPPEYWDGENILTGEINHYVPQTYDNGGWNQPNVVWWLDLDLPKKRSLKYDKRRV